MVLPALTPVTWPAVVEELPTVATVLSRTDQLANVVTSIENWVAGFPTIPYSPVAASGLVSPTITLLSVLGVTVMLMSGAADTVTLACPVTPESAARTVAVPAAMPVARPGLVAALETVRTAVLVEDQVTWAVRSAVVLSL